MASDPEYTKDFELKIIRGPKNECLVNQSVELLKQWPPDMKIRITIIQLRNDGRYVQVGKPIESSVCNMIDNDKVFYPSIFANSNFVKKCPVKIGKYYLKNFILPVDVFPPILIEAKGKSKVEFMLGKRQIIMFVAHGRVEKVQS